MDRSPSLVIVVHCNLARLIPAALAITGVLLSACGPGGVSPTATPALPVNATGIHELDVIVAAAVSGNPRALLPYLEFASLPCTTAEGLGGPPKCMPGESEGTAVDVLPFLGPGEGSFLRKSEMQTWVGPALARLYAAYQVSDAAYSDENYPAGEYALVLIGAGASLTVVTLQVRHGRVVRMDYGVARPAQIPPEAVKQYIVSPP